MLRVDDGWHGEYGAVGVVDDRIDRRFLYEVEEAGKVFLALVIVLEYEPGGSK